MAGVKDRFMERHREKDKMGNTSTHINWDYLCRISPRLFLGICIVLMMGFLVWAQIEFGIFGFFREYLFGN